MYPRPDRPLVPEALRPAVGAIPVPGRLARRLGLEPGVTLGDLDPAARNGLSADAVAALADLVVTTVRRADLGDLSANVFAPGLEVPLDQLDLNRRSHNALVLAGFVTNGELAPMSVSALARGKNIGAITVLDVLTEIERLESELPPPRPRGTAGPAEGRLSPSPAVRRAARPLLTRRWAPKVHRDDPRLGADLRAIHPTAETAREAGELLRDEPVNATDARHLARRIREFIEAADGSRHLSVETELDDILEAVVQSEQTREIISARLGFSGQAPVTLESAGRIAGLTCERARQIVQSFVKDMGARTSPWTPALDRALRIIRDSIPATNAELQDLLRGDGVCDGEFSLEALDEAARVFHRPWPFVRDESGFVLRDTDARPRDISATARKLVTHWGATTIDALLALLEDQGIRTSDTFARTVVESLSDFCWLDDAKEWFWLRDVPRNRLLNQVEKIMVVAGSIELADLRNGVGRHHRMQGFRPPREVLARLCADSGLYRRESTRIIGGAELPDWKNVLGDIERTLVEVLFDYGPVMRKDELLDRAVNGRGLNRNSVSVYLTYSPVLERYAPGVWGLRGAPVTAGDIQALIPPRVRRQVLQDHGWTSDGKVWVAYRLSPAAVESGVLGTPGVLRDVASGPFALLAEGAQPVGTLVIEDNMWGLSPFFRRWGVEPGDYLVLTLDLSSREATITAGEEELLLRYQSGE